MAALWRACSSTRSAATASPGSTGGGAPSRRARGQQGIEPAPVTALAGHRHAGVAGDQPPAMGVGLDAPVRDGVRTLPCAEPVLLGVQPGEHERRLGAEHPQPRPGRAGHRRGPQVADRARGMAQSDEDVVVGRQPTTGVDLGVDLGDGAEQCERLVGEMAAEVQQQPSALAGGLRLAPGPRLGRRAPALEPRLVADDLSQVAAVQQAPEREVIGVPAAVLEHRQQHAGALGAERRAARRWRPSPPAACPRRPAGRGRSPPPPGARGRRWARRSPPGRDHRAPTTGRRCSAPAPRGGRGPPRPVARGWRSRRWRRSARVWPRSAAHGRPGRRARIR